MVKTPNDQEYIPGVCNIGPAERAKRRQTGLIGVIASIILTITLLGVGAPRGWRLLLIIPVSAAALGYLQDSFHFCVGFGLKGLYNVIHSAGTTDNITLAEYREKDRRKAFSILSLSVAIGLGISLLYFMI